MLYPGDGEGGGGLSCRVVIGLYWPTLMLTLRPRLYTCQVNNCSGVHYDESAFAIFKRPAGFVLFS